MGDIEKITSATYLKKILNESNLYPNRAMGQHFLVDENIMKKIVSAAKLTKEDLVIDIGAGPGALSLTMAEKAGGVIAVEWDRGLSNLLRKQARIRGLKNLCVVEGDIRRLDLAAVCREKQVELFGSEALMGKIKIVANLPYYLTTPLLFKLLQGELKIDLLVLMVQLEAARRMVAVPGGKEYGLLSVLCQYYTTPHFLFKVSRHVFLPSPEVDSAVVLLKVPAKHPVKVSDETTFWKIIRAAFHKRRKTLLNALSGLKELEKDEWRTLLHKSEISPMRRGETLSVEEFANLSEVFYNNKGI